MKKRRVFLDPLHGNVELDCKQPQDELLFELIQTTAFQRLRRIKQLGFSFLTFYGAEGNRFVHSIGAMWLAKKFLASLKLREPEKVAPYETAILVAALLHDIGHGPFSHCSEPAFGFRHERFTEHLIVQEDELSSILRSHHKDLPEKVVNVLRGQAVPPWVTSVVSGQLDCDRGDYLMRDSFQTGAKYGTFQLERVIETLSIDSWQGQDHMVVREKGIHAVEDYLFARYSMYLQVYHHKKTLAADRMFVALMQRVRDLLGRETVEPNLSMWLRDMDKVSVESFLAVDDVTLTYHFKLWGKQAKDSICRDLADRLMQRRLFKARKYSPEAEAVVRRNMAPEVARFYCLHGDSREFPYHDRRQPVLVERGGEILEMSQASAVAQALLNKRRELDVDWLFAPPESIDVLD